MKITVTNTGIILEPENAEDDDGVEELDDETTYMVKGAWHDPNYKAGLWDGRERLLSKESRFKWSAPVGILADALERFPDAEVVDDRRQGAATPELALNPDVIPELRPYQHEAVEAVVADRDVLTGKGLLRLPTRSGKTVIAAAIIAHTGLRSLFVVNSDMLLRQTISLFSRALRLVNRSGKANRRAARKLVGQFGGGVHETDAHVTVASVQGLLARAGTMPVRELLSGSQAVFFDECHHLEAPRWRLIMNRADALYKIGLSATIYLDKQRGTELGTIWLVGATGPVLYSLTPSDLIEAGWLNRPVITFVSAPDPDVVIDSEAQFTTKYRLGITENTGRNAKIVELAARESLAGRRVLVTVRHLAHVDELARMMRGLGLVVSVVTGKTPAEQRDELCADVRDGRADVLIGTVFGEAVDLPWLETVIVADGLASKVLTMQRLRNLTPVDEHGRPLREPRIPPDEVPVYDFADFGERLLAEHSAKRLAAYREHPSFRVGWQR